MSIKRLGLVSLSRVEAVEAFTDTLTANFHQFAQVIDHSSLRFSFFCFSPFYLFISSSNCLKVFCFNKSNMRLMTRIKIILLFFLHVVSAFFFLLAVGGDEWGWDVSASKPVS